MIRWCAPLPDEVLPAEEFPVAREASLGERAPALAALHAVRVPSAVQHVEQEAVQDGPRAARALHHASGTDSAPRAARPARTLGAWQRRGSWETRTQEGVCVSVCDGGVGARAQCPTRVSWPKTFRLADFLFIYFCIIPSTLARYSCARYMRFRDIQATTKKR